jgi:hypothetical protein
MGKKTFKQIDGKKQILTAKDLDEILGATNKIYKTADVEKYKEGLREMNLADLQAHAIEIGLLPTDNRSVLTERLLREFRKNTACYRNAAFQTQETLTTDQQKAALKIINP